MLTRSYLLLLLLSIQSIIITASDTSDNTNQQPRTTQRFSHNPYKGVDCGPKDQSAHRNITYYWNQLHPEERAAYNRHSQLIAHYNIALFWNRLHPEERAAYNLSLQASLHPLQQNNS